MKQTNKFMNIYLGLSLLCFYIGINSAKAQLTYTDDFSDNTSATQVTSGLIGTSGANNWFVTRSGGDWGAKRNTSPAQLELTNDASATANANGWVFAQTVTQHHPTLNLNTDVTWSFNMRQSTADPDGFAVGGYGVAFVLAGSSTTAATGGQGYAVVLGQTGTDPVRLVRYNNGLQGTLTNIVASNTSGLTDFGADYLSVKVVYTASTNTWELLLRNDGASAFADPSTGTALISQGTPVADNTYTGTTLSFMGAYWQGSTAANQTAFFDNVKVVANTGAFVTTWVPAATSLTIPTTGTGYSYAATCQNMTTSTTAAVAVTGRTGNNAFTGLTAASTYRVFITGTFPRIYFNGGTEKAIIRTIEQWGTIAWTNMANAFQGCSNLTTANGNPILTGVTDMTSMFSSCTNFNGNITDWNTAAVTNMSSLFASASAFNQDISTWNTAAVTNMSGMFANTAFNQDIGIWNTAKVTNMSGMFVNTVFNKDISTWNTAAVTTMNSMFSGASAFNQDISAWNTAKVVGMNQMFRDATTFNQDLNIWNTTAVIDIALMFYGCTNFNGNITGWNTAKVTNMSYMFQNTSVFNQNISTWNTAAVTNMSYMFSGASAFNQNLGNWTLNTSVNLGLMLDNSGMSCGNYSATLVAWAAQSGVPTSRSLGASGRQYGTDAVAARTTLTTTKSWTITGDAASGVACIVPEINVQGNSNNITYGSNAPSTTNHTDFGTTSSNLIRTFTIQNTGVATLTISSISSNNTKFVIGTAPTSILGGTSATFTVTFIATTPSTYNARITINNNDSDEAVYDFAVTGSSNIVLPVELLSFEGKNIEVRNPATGGTEGGNFLTWTTANEVNNKGFQVERRQATADTWDAIGFVAANNKASNYQFLDDKPTARFQTSPSVGSPSVNYYRLRQIDKDGKETLSKVVSIQSKGNDKLKVYPNPVSHQLTIETEVKGDYHIFNLLGQVVLSARTPSERGPAATQQIDVSALPKGNYVLKVGEEQARFNKLN